MSRSEVLEETKRAISSALSPRGDALHPVDAAIDRIIAMVRPRVEHPFRVLKQQLRCPQNRYRGLAKNRAQQAARPLQGRLCPKLGEAIAVDHTIRLRHKIRAAFRDHLRP